MTENWYDSIVTALKNSIEAVFIKKSNTNGLVKNDGSIDQSTYLTTSSASSTYLSKTDAQSTYVAKENGKGLFTGSYSDLTNKPSYTATVTSSDTGAYKIGSINISGSSVDIYGKDTDTHQSLTNYVQKSETTDIIGDVLDGIIATEPLIITITNIPTLYGEIYIKDYVENINYYTTFTEYDWDTGVRIDNIKTTLLSNDKYKAVFKLPFDVVLENIVWYNYRSDYMAEDDYSLYFYDVDEEDIIDGFLTVDYDDLPQQAPS